MQRSRPTPTTTKSTAAPVICAQAHMLISAAHAVPEPPHLGTRCTTLAGKRSCYCCQNCWRFQTPNKLFLSPGSALPG